MSAFTRHEIAQIFNKARRVLRHPGFDVLALPSTHAGGRLLVVTPRKVGNAPQRNKIRRRLKAIFHEENFCAYGIDFIVIIKPGGTALSFEQLKMVFTDAVMRSTLLCGKQESKHSSID
jgi:ribonuclease P protein component